MDKMTALEWLMEELESYGDRQHCKLEWEDLESLIQQALEKEKQQIIQAVYDSMGTNFDPNMGRAELYYNEKYGK